MFRAVPDQEATRNWRVFILYYVSFPFNSSEFPCFIGFSEMEIYTAESSSHLFPPVFHIKTQQRYVGGGMELLPIYQKPNMSRPAKRHETYPYLLRGLRVTRPNQIYFPKMNTGGTLRHLNEWMTAMRDFSAVRCKSMILGFVYAASSKGGKHRKTPCFLGVCFFWIFI